MVKLPRVQYMVHHMQIDWGVNITWYVVLDIWGFIWARQVGNDYGDVLMILRNMCHLELGYNDMLHALFRIWYNNDMVNSPPNFIKKMILSQVRWSDCGCKKWLIIWK